MPEIFISVSSRMNVKGPTAAYFPAVGTVMAYQTTDGNVRFARVIASNATINTFTIYAPPISASDSNDAAILGIVGLGSPGGNGTAWLVPYPIDISALNNLGSTQVTGRT